MTMDEVLRMDITQALIILRGQKVLKVNKYDYTLHPESKKLKPQKATEYIPEWRKPEENHSSSNTPPATKPRQRNQSKNTNRAEKKKDQNETLGTKKESTESSFSDDTVEYEDLSKKSTENRDSKIVETSKDDIMSM